MAPRLVDFTGLPEQGSMLDVGSGTGALTAVLAERNVRTRVLGIDPSPQYVAYAASQNSFPHRAGFEVGEAGQLRFAAASFDAALSLLVFNFIPDPKQAVLELRRVTKPMGKISAAVWDYGAGMRMLRAFWDAAVNFDPEAEKLDEKHMPLCREGESSSLWKEGGLDNVHEQPIEIEMRFRSFSDYWDPFLLGQGPAGAYVRRLDREQLERLRSELAVRLSWKPENKPLILSARAWAVRGSVPGAS